MFEIKEYLEFIIDLFMCHFILIKRLESIETKIDFEYANANAIKLVILNVEDK